MSTSCSLSDQGSDDALAILSILILGAGFIGMFAGFSSFWLIWVLGYVVVLPIVAILTDTNEWEGTKNEEWTAEGNQREPEQHTASAESTSTQDALSTLRERYARGDLTDGQFERKLDRLLETETPENAAEWRKRATRGIETEKST